MVAGLDVLQKAWTHSKFLRGIQKFPGLLVCFVVWRGFEGSEMNVTVLTNRTSTALEDGSTWGMVL